MNNNDVIQSALKFNITQIGFTYAKLYNDATGEDYKSAIVALFPYYINKDECSNLSMYARGKDYHIVIRNIFSDIMHQVGITDYKIFSDTGPLIDRALAVQAGLGFIGKNNMLINDRYGTYCFIGYVVCNEEFEMNTPLDKECKGCNMCVNLCPGKALGENGSFCEEKCLSYITQKKGEHTPYERMLILENGCIFGCDVCQKVCPHNLCAYETDINDFKDDLIDNLSLCDIEKLSNKEFKRIYGERAFSWRGKAVLERNLKYFKA